MSLKVKFAEIEFGVGDQVRVLQKIKEGEKDRQYVFEGMVIAITKSSFTVRKIGDNQIGIERIFPRFSPTVISVTVVKEGHKGVRHAKLYYTRTKSKREIDSIYKRHILKK